ncbi:MAG: cytidylate kinase-like family protein [Bacteroidales bacterium]|nr:cytidylate kinase-like family protein [Bacteroidales bacterium]HPD95460.1 cytidylate kinase-like family protein [Tenuifilaceae bacterium]HRX31375.1 cytidylate kinase-like family protein [Tenuifilaceae bacterium]
MSHDLIKYFSNRNSRTKQLLKEPGPVVTISREMGCPGTSVTSKLVQEINHRYKFKDEDLWKWLEKDRVLKLASKLLGLPQEDIDYVFEAKRKGIMTEILQSMSMKYYKSDRRIQNTVKSVIRSEASKGRVVILGRGGVAITRDIPRSLHIHIEAPFEWRVLRVEEKYKFDTKAAEFYVKEIDKKREEVRTYFGGKDTDYTRFDITFNAMTISIDEMVDIIIHAMEVRDIIY